MCHRRIDLNVRSEGKIISKTKEDKKCGNVDMDETVWYRFYLTDVNLETISTTNPMSLCGPVDLAQVTFWGLFTLSAAGNTKPSDSSPVGFLNLNALGKEGNTRPYTITN